MDWIAGSKQGWQPGKRRLGAFLAAVLVLCCASLSMMNLRHWHGLKQKERHLDVSLVSRSTADYSARRPVILTAPVGLGVINDRIRDSRPDPAELPVRLAAVTTMLHRPIPGTRPAKTPKSLRTDSKRSAGTGSTPPPPPRTERSRPDKRDDPMPGKRDSSNKPDKSSNSDKASRSTRADGPDRQDNRGQAKKK